jgi:hypothetical protein
MRKKRLKRIQVGEKCQVLKNALVITRKFVFLPVSCGFPEDLNGFLSGITDYNFLQLNGVS